MIPCSNDPEQYKTDGKTLKILADKSLDPSALVNSVKMLKGVESDPFLDTLLHNCKLRMTESRTVSEYEDMLHGYMLRVDIVDIHADPKVRKAVETTLKLTGDYITEMWGKRLGA